MINALYVAKTGLSAQDTQLSVIANNLANVSTTGFKKDRAVFEDLLYQTKRTPGSASSQNTTLPSGLQLGSGVRVVGTQKVFTEGSQEITENPLHVSIIGKGFFQLIDPQGQTVYSRNGEFHLNENSEFVNTLGYLVDPQISLPEDVESITIGLDGTVSALVPGQSDPIQVGQLDTVNFVNPAGLLAIGNNLFRETTASGSPITGTPGQDGLGQLQQGALENSNVSAVEELVDMITTQRAYEMNSKVISTADQMLSFVTQQL